MRFCKAVCFLFLFTLPLGSQSIQESYRAAVAETVQAGQSDISTSLVRIDPDMPARVATWTRAGLLDRLKDRKGAWLKKAPYDIWVTVVPKLRQFCQAFAREHPADAGALTLRLEERLGLPPGTNKDTFVEITVKRPSKTKNIFRPCVDPSVQTTTCPLGPPKAGAGEDHEEWIYRQYYGSFGLSNQYPWTALGYTFDWAPREGGPGFVRFGESEFVIPEGAPIEIEAAMPTTQYCSVQ